MVHRLRQSRPAQAELLAEHAVDLHCSPELCQSAIVGQMAFSIGPAGPVEPDKALDRCRRQVEVRN